MEFFDVESTPEETLKFIRKMQYEYEYMGYCYFAVDLLENNEFIGFIGLLYQDYDADFTPCVDIGWRLKKSSWGHGYATEGANACLEFGFKVLALKKVYSTTPAINVKSEHVMLKIGMQKVGNFDHPKLLGNVRLKDCVVYSISKNMLNVTQNGG